MKSVEKIGKLADIPMLLNYETIYQNIYIQIIQTFVSNTSIVNSYTPLSSLLKTFNIVPNRSILQKTSLYYSNIYRDTIQIIIYKFSVTDFGIKTFKKH